MEEEPLSSNVKDEDIIPDEYAVEYDIGEISRVLAEIRDIENVFDNFKEQLYTIETSIKNCRLALHKLEKEEDLPL
tara:strand:+ start:678 stop:905 length:228 start_codon:yes stop_codon:yes gene_type:complete